MQDQRSGGKEEGVRGGMLPAGRMRFVNLRRERQKTGSRTEIVILRHLGNFQLSLLAPSCKPSFQNNTYCDDVAIGDTAAGAQQIIGNISPGPTGGVVLFAARSWAL